MAQKRALIADRERIEADAQARLNLPENRTMWSESQYLNSLIERKAFSWTRVLENLEKSCPHGCTWFRLARNWMTTTNLP